MDENKIYVNQTALAFEATVGQDITNAQANIIKYIKPDKSKGFWQATSVLSAPEGIFEYKVDEDGEDVDQIGDWIMWGHSTFEDGTYAAGLPTTVIVYEEGT